MSTTYPGQRRSSVTEYITKMFTETTGFVTRDVRKIDAGFFYRVESSNVVTRYVPKPRGENLFEALASFPTDMIRKRNVEGHLNWSNREPSPFISVFDNFDSALKRARFFCEQGDQKIVIVKMDARGLVSGKTIEDIVDGSVVNIPIWESISSDECWLSMAEVGPVLQMPHHHIDKSEWISFEVIRSARHIATMPVRGNTVWLPWGSAQPLRQLLMDYGPEDIILPLKDFSMTNHE